MPKKEAELSLGQVQQGGMKQQERTQPLLHRISYTFILPVSTAATVLMQHARHAPGAYQTGSATCGPRSCTAGPTPNR